MIVKAYSLQEINELISEHFIKIFGSIVEHLPSAGVGILKYRPFRSVADITKALNHHLDSLKASDKEIILQYHPDIITNSDISRLFLDLDLNQSVDSIVFTISDKQKLNQLNRKYKEKFGFPFVISCKNLNLICAEMEMRLENSKDVEIELAIEELKKKSKLRILEVIQC